MEFTTLENAVHNLRQMAKQNICPGDRFFGPLADEIEKLVQFSTDSQADAIRWRAARDILIERGCPIREGCHIPTIIEQWLNG